MDTQTNNKQENSFFLKYFKSIVLILIIILVFISTFVVFIKYGSNNFLWATQKDKLDPGDFASRTKRAVEDRIKELKHNKKLNIDLDFLENNNNIELLENKINMLEAELEAYKKKEELKNENDTNPLHLDLKIPTTEITKPVVSSVEENKIITDHMLDVLDSKDENIETSIIKKDSLSTDDGLTNSEESLVKIDPLSEDD